MRRLLPALILLIVGASLGAGATILFRGNGDPPSPTPTPNPEERSRVAEIVDEFVQIDSEISDRLFELDESRTSVASGQPSGDEGESLSRLLTDLDEIRTELLSLRVTEGLEESRALFLEAVNLASASANSLRVAATTEDEAVVQLSLDQSLDLMGQSVWAVQMAKRLAEKERARLGLGDETTRGLFLDGPAPTPPGPRTRPAP